jgi:putative transposase
MRSTFAYAKDNALVHMAWPKELRKKLHSTDPLKLLNRKIKLHTNVVG